MTLLLIVYIAGYLLTLRPLITFLIDDLRTIARLDAGDIVFSASMGAVMALAWPILVPARLLYNLSRPRIEAYAERLNNDRPTLPRY